MIPSKTLQTQIATLIAGDATTLGSSTAMHVHLAKAAFTPSPNLDPATLTEADFAGYAAIDPTTGTQLIYQDPVTGLITVEIKEPVGGWHFQTTGTGQLPQTIYGWYLTDSTDAVLYGSGLLDTPVPLAISGQGFNLPTLTFAFANNSPT
jgi:hypothetical protein